LNPHVPLTHAGLALLGADVHVVQLAPQCSAELRMSTHAPPQFPSGELHPSEHVPFEHVEYPPSGTGHALHPPQLAVDVGSTHAPPQSSRGALHAIPHTPAVHVGVPLGGAVQRWPQPPQFSMEEAVSPQGDASLASDSAPPSLALELPSVWTLAASMVALVASPEASTPPSTPASKSEPLHALLDEAIAMRTASPPAFVF
jgi:hypothetical protein